MLYFNPDTGEAAVGTVHVMRKVPQALPSTKARRLSLKVEEMVLGLEIHLQNGTYNAYDSKILKGLCALNSWRSLDKAVQKRIEAIIGSTKAEAEREYASLNKFITDCENLKCGNANLRAPLHALLGNPFILDHERERLLSATWRCEPQSLCEKIYQAVVRDKPLITQDEITELQNVLWDLEARWSNETYIKTAKVHLVFLKKLMEMQGSDLTRKPEDE